MSVAAITSTTTNTTAQTAAAAATVVGKDDFLKLLVAQLENQDPLNPMDGTEFTAQLAQFSSLETLQSIDGGLSDLNAAQSTLHNSQAVSLIGKTVLYEGDTFSYTGEGMSDIQFRLDEPSCRLSEIIEGGASNDSFPVALIAKTGIPLTSTAYRAALPEGIPPQVVMLNVTPTRHREHFQIYPNGDV